MKALGILKMWPFKIPRIKNNGECEKKHVTERSGCPAHVCNAK